MTPVLQVGFCPPGGLEPTDGCRSAIGRPILMLPAMTTTELLLLERLKQLPPARVAEVVDFVEFLACREERRMAAGRLNAGLSRLDALQLPSLTEDDIEAEIRAARHDRPAG